MHSSNIFSPFQNIIIFSFPLISIIGFVSNILAFVIFSRKKFQNTIFSIYFRFFILFDTLTLILPINKLLEIHFDIIIANISDELCKLRYYYAYVLVPISSWTLVFISIDRFLSISYPNRFNFRKKKKFHVTVTAIILLFNLVYYIPNLFYNIKANNYYSNETNSTIEYTSCKNPGFSLKLMDLFQSTLLPFIFMIFFSSITVQKLFKVRRRANSNNLATNKSRHKDIRFAIISISLNFMFLLMKIPYFIISLLNDYTNLFQDKYELFKFILTITLASFYSNSATVFYVNIFVNTSFRNEFKKLFLEIEKKYADMKIKRRDEN
jgi:hypothetical protein